MLNSENEHTPLRITRVVWVTLLVVASMMSGVGAGESVHLRAEVEHNADDKVTIALYQTTASVAPSVLVLFLLFDNSEMELVPVENGLYTQLAPEHDAKGFVVADVYHNGIDDVPGKGCLAIAVYKPGSQSTLSPGALLSFSLQFTPAGTEKSNPRIEAITQDKPVFINGNRVSSSAATAEERSLGVLMEPLTIPLNCAPPQPPEQVRASRRYRDRIVVSWNPPDTDSALEYRVYRSAESDPSHAVPVHDSWVTAEVFLDMLDDDDIEKLPTGCACASVRYYYWVRARDSVTQCESDFSTPAARGTLISWWPF